MNPVSLSIGSSHSLMTDSNGILWGFGSNNDGQLGTKDPRDVHQPQKYPGKVREVACGSHHTILIDADDKLWSFGNGGDGRLGNNNQSIDPTPFQHSIENAKTISSGWRHSAVIDNKGILRTFGCNSNGQLGMGDAISRGAPAIVMEIDGAYQVSCGGKHTAVVDIFGNLWSFGDNFQGQLGVSDSQRHRKPVWVSGVKLCRFVACGWEHTAVIDTNNNLWMFGCNDHGQLGLADEGVNLPFQFTPTMVLSNVKSVSTGGNYTMAVTFDSQVYACGSNLEGQCGLPEAKLYRTFTKVESLPPIDHLVCHQASLAVDSTGKVWGFGANCSGELGSNLSEFNKKGNVILQPPQVIQGLQAYLRHVSVKSSRSIPLR